MRTLVYLHTSHYNTSKHSLAVEKHAIPPRAAGLLPKHEPYVEKQGLDRVACSLSMHSFRHPWLEQASHTGSGTCNQNRQVIQGNMQF